MCCLVKIVLVYFILTQNDGELKNRNLLPQRVFTIFRCLLDWANPNCLGTSVDFEERFARPITVGQRFDANKRELATARKSECLILFVHTIFSRSLARSPHVVLEKSPTTMHKLLLFLPQSNKNLFNFIVNGCFVEQKTSSKTSSP